MEEEKDHAVVLLIRREWQGPFHFVAKTDFLKSLDPSSAKAEVVGLTKEEAESVARDLNLLEEVLGS